MYDNIFQPVTSLQKSPIVTGGLCSVKYFRIEDVAVWPVIDPTTGIISEALQMKPGKSIYFLTAAEKDKTFSEDAKFGAEGPYMDINVTGVLTGNTALNTLVLQSMLFHRYGLLVDDRDGLTRLIGNEDSGASLIYNYTSADAGSSRKRQLKFNWQHSLPAPIYSSQSFNIPVGDVILTAGAITLVVRFQVGALGAPMVDGDTLYTNNLLTNKKALVIASSLILPVDDLTGTVDYTGSNFRRVEKADSSNQITFVGGVVNKEIIEIYAFN